MKVIVSVFNNLYTDQRVEKVCESLGKNGYHVILLGNNWGGAPEMERSYPYSRIALKSKILRYAYLEFQWRLYKELLKKADKNCILLSNDLDTLLPNYLISKKLRIPLLFDSHEIFTKMPALQRRFTQKIWRILERWVMPNLKYVLTASESYSDWFVKTYEMARPITVQNFPVKTVNSQNYDEINCPKIILYQGVINPSRGLDKIIPAMSEIENAELWIAGDGPQKIALENLTNSLSLHHKVKFLGKLLPKKLAEITRKADVGLSIEENNGLSYYYSMPNKVSDYIQARIPVVVSDFPEMRKVIDRFQAGEKMSCHDQLAEKIRLVLKNGKLYYKDALNTAATELCWENEEPKLLNLFEKVKAENF